MIASMGGGLVGLSFSLTNPNGIDILSQINGVLGALVAVTGICLINIIRESSGGLEQIFECFYMFESCVRWVFSLQRLGSDDSRDDRWFYHVCRNVSVG